MSKNNYTSQNRLIIERIPISPRSRMRDYLAKRFGVSKESAYRRIKGETPFTLEEVIQMSVEFGFSIDEIIERSTPGSSKDGLLISERNFLKMLSDYYNYIQSVSEAEKKEVLLSMNRINLFLLAEYNFLFKWFYYKWMHRAQPVSIHTPFSSIVIPEEIENVRLKLVEQIKNIKKVGFIIHKDLFSNLVNEIHYYYWRRKFISKEEFLVLKEELSRLLKDLESKMDGEQGDGYDFYLSDLDVDSNSICCSFQTNTIASLHWLYSLKIVVVKNYKMCEEHIQWLKSMREGAVLMSRSNELLRINFLEKQNEYIKQMAANNEAAQTFYPLLDVAYRK
jgi:hypothetical protein